jgi:hypothetical protein
VSVLEGLFLKYIRMNKKYIGVYFAISSALLFAGAGCPTNVSREIGESEEVKQAVVSEVTSTENIGSVSVGQENKADDSKVQQKKNESENENEGEEERDKAEKERKEAEKERDKAEKERKKLNGAKNKVVKLKEDIIKNREKIEKEREKREKQKERKKK